MHYAELHSEDPADPEHQVGRVAEWLSLVEELKGVGMKTLVDAGGQPLGSFILSHSRLCWVFWRGGRPHLSDLLAKDFPEHHQLMTRLAVKAKAEGKRFGELLTSMNLVPSNRIRERLLDQIVDGLTAISSWPGEIRWQRMVLMADSYEAELTFSATEIFHAFVRRCYPLQGVVADIYNEWAPRSDWGILLREVKNGAAFPVEVTNYDDTSFRTSLKLSRDLWQMVSPPALIAAEIFPRFNIYVDENGVWVAMSLARWTAILRVQSVQEAAQILSRYRHTEHAPRPA